MKEFRCNENCELFKGNCGKHHIDWQGHTIWDCPHEQYYTGVLGDVPSCFRPSKEFKEKQRLNKQITIGEMEAILDKIREQIKSNLRGVEIALEVLNENHPLRPKMEGAKDTLEECLELIDKAETEADK